MHVEYSPDMTFGDVTVTTGDDFVATVEIHRPPHNYFDVALIRSLAEAYETLDGQSECRAIVLCAEGKSFCAGAELGRAAPDAGGPVSLYTEAARLLAAATPVVAAVQGAAI